MRKFFLEEMNIHTGGKYLLSKDDSYHVITVLRHNINQEEIIICDGNGHNFHAKVTNHYQHLAEVTIMDEIDMDHEPAVDVHLYMSLIKAEKFEMALQKCAEVGVREITPMLTERTIIKVDDSKEDRKVERWNKIVQEACKQSNRSYIPSVNKPMKFNECLSRNNNNMIIAYVEENQHNLKECLSQIESDTIQLLIGPEGGFSPSEIKRAKDHHVMTTHLGSLILRAETAAIVATSLILFHKEQMDEKH
ncbi:MAG: 16S rRNA (uracil(1498)-N(3))-methyltransferase [Clostridia bacterium]|nr:16S rRNA (uracil(1498)-N(3))-methyltransferase [Clostridia bacterium]